MRPVAVSMQLPQLEPQPVRIISSDMEPQPASAASRISLSVMPWQRQTYKARTWIVGQVHSGPNRE